MKSLREELALLINNNSDEKESQLDLNLLPFFLDAFRCSTNLPAKRIQGGSDLSRSQNIKKLRHYFNDPLFIMQGERLVVTPFARELYARINKELFFLLDSIEIISSRTRSKGK